MSGLLRSLFRRSALSDAEIAQEKEKLLRAAPVPRLWLFGKTGSGKTSIVRCLTGADDAEIGNGFRPQTRFTREFEFPNAEAPILRFIDTRGLGEARYDAREDIEKLSVDSHLMIVVVRVMDHALGDVVGPLQTIRGLQPDRPVLLALTCLHEAYPGEQHPDPDPFETGGDSLGIPQELQRSIELQRERFQGLVDDVVAIDLTRPEEGYDVPDFGSERLQRAILGLLPEAYRHSFAGFEEARKSLRSMNEKRALPEIVSHSILAATAAAVPLPWIDIPAVLGIQSNLVRRVAAIYGQEMSSRLVLDMAGAAGSRMMLQLAIREPLKFVPVLGMAASAAFSFAYTFGLGKAACWYFGELRKGNTPSRKDVEAVWNDSIQLARQLWARGGSQEGLNGQSPPTGN